MPTKYVCTVKAGVLTSGQYPQYLADERPLTNVMPLVIKNAKLVGGSNPPGDVFVLSGIVEIWEAQA